MPSSRGRTRYNSAKSERVMDDAQAKEFQACACFAIKLAEEAEDFAARDNLLTLIRAWLAAAKDVQSSVDEVRLSSGIR
jgi:hypothetical protein